MKDYDFYLFDWDGTLANSTEVWLAAMHKHLLPYGLDLPRETLLKTMGNWYDLIPHGLPADAIDDYHHAAGDEAVNHLHEAPLFDDAEAVLRALKRDGKKLAVVTASHRAAIDMVLRLHGFEGLFDAVVCGSDVENHKPHPEPVLLALQKLGVTDKKRAVMIGDTTRDLLAARDAGIDNLLFFPEGAHFDLKELCAVCEPTAIVHTWAEFAPHILR